MSWFSILHGWWKDLVRSTTCAWPGDAKRDFPSAQWIPSSVELFWNCVGNVLRLSVGKRHATGPIDFTLQGKEIKKPRCYFIEHSCSIRLSGCLRRKQALLSTLFFSYSWGFLCRLCFIWLRSITATLLTVSRHFTRGPFGPCVTRTRYNNMTRTTGYVQYKSYTFSLFWFPTRKGICSLHKANRIPRQVHTTNSSTRRPRSLSTTINLLNKSAQHLMQVLFVINLFWLWPYSCRNKVSVG